MPKPAIDAPLDAVGITRLSTFIFNLSFQSSAHGGANRMGHSRSSRLATEPIWALEDVDGRKRRLVSASGPSGWVLFFQMYFGPASDDVCRWATAGVQAEQRWSSPIKLWPVLLTEVSWNQIRQRNLFLKPRTAPPSPYTLRESCPVPR